MLTSRQGAEHSLASLFARAEAGVVSVGRAAGNTLSMARQLELPGYSTAALTLSRRHALLQVRDGQLQVLDDATVNGTYVNGQRLNEGIWRVLNEGDVVSLGG